MKKTLKTPLNLFGITIILIFLDVSLRFINEAFDIVYPRPFLFAVKNYTVFSVLGMITLYFVYFLIIVGWVYLLAVIVFHYGRKLIHGTLAVYLRYFLAMTICFLAFFLYWLRAERGNIDTLQVGAAIYPILGFFLELMYRTMFRDQEVEKSKLNYAD